MSFIDDTKGNSTSIIPIVKIDDEYFSYSNLNMEIDPEVLFGQSILQFGTGATEEYAAGQTFQKALSDPLATIYDILKEKGILKFKHNGVKFKMIDEVIQMPDIKYDFVGIDEHLDISLSLLEVHLGYSIVSPAKWKPPYEYIDYKYDELKEFLKEDIELYNKYSNKLMEITKQIMEVK